MGLIEAILIGIQFKRLEKPIVFLSMLVCFLAFCTFGVAIILASIEGFSNGKPFLALVGFSSFSFSCLFVSKLRQNAHHFVYHFY